MKPKETVIFKPSNVHQGHYAYINGQDTGIVVNLYAYKTISEYKTEKDKQISQWNKLKE